MGFKKVFLAFLLLLFTAAVYANPIEDVRKKAIDTKREVLHQQQEQPPQEEKAAPAVNIDVLGIATTYREFKDDLKELKLWAKKFVNCLCNIVLILMLVTPMIIMLKDYKDEFLFTAKLLIAIEIARVFTG